MAGAAPFDLFGRKYTDPNFFGCQQELLLKELSTCPSILSRRASKRTALCQKDIYIHIHICIYVCIYIRICIYFFSKGLQKDTHDLHLEVRVLRQLQQSADLQASDSDFTKFTCFWRCVCIYVYIYMYVFMYIYIYIDI